MLTAPFNGPYPALFNHKGLRTAFQCWRRLTGTTAEDDSAEVLANRLLRLAQRDSAIPKPDLIWGITVGFLAGPVAAQRLGEYFGCPCVVEFQDPVPHPGRAPLIPERQVLLESCLARCALVITTTEGITKKVQKDFPAVRGKVRTFHLSYDEDVPVRPTARPTDAPLVLVHAGVLYGGDGRNATSLVKAIARAAKLDAAVQGRIQLRLIGASAGGQEATDLARDLGVPWAVETLPQIPAPACLLEMDRADVLVVIKFDDAEYDLQVPGKVFQCLGRGKPVLGLMRETEAAAILRQSGLGTILPNADVDGIAKALLDYWRHRHTLADRFRPRWDYIRQFSLSSFAGSLHVELSKIVQWECVLEPRATGES
jgi:hypothetical protein